MAQLKVLTVTDLHQRMALYSSLEEEVKAHRPDIVACVGDFLDAGDPRTRGRMTAAEAAKRLASLEVEHVLFARGNHEEEEWRAFVDAWPHDKRPLVALHGSAYVVGPCVIVGFPCFTGWPGYWEDTMPAQGNVLHRDAGERGRSLPDKITLWLRPLLNQYGPAARGLWLMHEPPLSAPVAHPIAANSFFKEAVERYQPLLVISGHDHETPLKTGQWRAPIGRTTCINAGQGRSRLHFCLIECSFEGSEASLPKDLQVTAFPWREKVAIQTSPQ